MEKIQRPIVLSIAGFDPCGGAGILADIKTFECLEVYGLAVNTALTLQSETHFETLQWRTNEEIQHEIKFLFQHYPIKAVKIGIVKDNLMLKSILSIIPKKDIFIVWDPVISSSTSKSIFETPSLSQVKNLLQDIYIITPNAKEACILSEKQDIQQAGLSLSSFTHVLIKGGHHEHELGTDYLFIKQKTKPIKISPQLTSNIYPKHGSGCVFSSALTAYLAKNYSLEHAALLAKKYVETFLSSNESLLGYHKKI